jgi:hypothetical protein
MVVVAPSAASATAMASASESAKETFSALASSPTLVLKDGNTFNWAEAFAKTQTKKTEKKIVLAPPDVSVNKVTN